MTLRHSVGFFATKRAPLRKTNESSLSSDYMRENQIRLFLKKRSIAVWLFWTIAPSIVVKTTTRCRDP